MRLVDVTLSFPPVLLAMAVAASLGPGLQNAAIAMIIVWWPVYARLMRGQVLEVKEREHVEAAIAGGASRWRLLTKHILSLCWTPDAGQRHHGFRPGRAARRLALLHRPRRSAADAGMGLDDLRRRDRVSTPGGSRFGPGMAILTVVLGFNFIGDGLRDILDPRTD